MVLGQAVRVGLQRSQEVVARSAVGAAVGGLAPLSAKGDPTGDDPLPQQRRVGFRRGTGQRTGTAGLERCRHLDNLSPGPRDFGGKRASRSRHLTRSLAVDSENYWR